MKEKAELEIQIKRVQLQAIHWMYMGKRKIIFLKAIFFEAFLMVVFLSVAIYFQMSGKVGIIGSSFFICFTLLTIIIGIVTLKRVERKYKEISRLEDIEREKVNKEGCLMQQKKG